MRWLRNRYHRFIDALASRLAAHLLEAIARGVASPLPSPIVLAEAVRRDAEGIRAETWYPMLAQTVLAASMTHRDGDEKREAVVATMHKWFQQRNLHTPSKRFLHLAIETALTYPTQKG